MPQNKSDKQELFSELRPISIREGFRRRYSWKKYVALLFLVLSILISAPKPTYAFDPFTPIIAMWDGLKYVGDKVYNIGKDLLGKAGSIALNSAVSNSLNRIAYDTATWLGSGGTGQKPQYFTGSPLSEWQNVGNAAAGDFIQAFGKQEGLDFCKPSLSAKISIGLGLVNEQRPPNPECTASQMLDNWSSAVSSKNFLKDFSKYFDIQQNDLGIALSAQTSILTAQQNAQLNSQMNMQMNGRYKENVNIAGDILGIPNQAKEQQQLATDLKANNYVKYTGDALVDAAGVFVNQLATTYLNHLQQNFTKYLTSAGNNSSGNDSLTDFNAEPANGGVAAAQGVSLQIAQPNFSTNADYDILAALSTCNDSVFGGVGPTDCVIDNKFRQAIENHETVAQAIKDGSLNGQATFGFVLGGDTKPIEPVWNQGYPYRSLIILRKYSIIPVGWELAAQYIQTNPSDPNVKIHNNLNDLVACFDPGDSYTGYNDDGAQKWCQGLVDPTWVLKAPQNYCAKQGYGPQIMDSQVTDSGTDANNNKLPPKLSVTRSDTYCGDEQSCISENSDGTCKYFGYCSSDKRQWKFGDNGSCNAEFNTCQTFGGGQGGQVSYLENTLQSCDASQAGCHEYEIPSADGYTALTGRLDWTKSTDQIWLNKNAATCGQSDEGCHQFLRYASGLGVNLVTNGSFIDDLSGAAPANWLSNDAKVISPDTTGHGGNVVQISSDLHSMDWSAGGGTSVFPSGFVMEPEVSYTLSADVYPLSGTMSVAIGRGGNWSAGANSVNSGSGWQTIYTTLANNADVAANEIKISGSGYVANIKFEVGTSPTAFSSYASNAIYEKFMPDYLKDACYTNADSGDYSLKTGAPAACSKFALQCNQDDVGCDSYKNNENSAQAVITAVVNDSNVCPSECDGYNTYVRGQDNFFPSKLDYLIPSTAKTCSLAAVGCHEFTNLAAGTSGGEQRQYYSYLRQCDQPSAACTDFYSWQGSNTEGQQLIKYSLKANGTQPAINDPTAASACDQTKYNLPPTNPAYNADCRQFYDQKGNVSYALYSQTITCSAACASLRLTPDSSLPAGAAQTCLSGGTWDGTQGGCVYKALTSESSVCSAGDNGCSDFSGNGGANSQTIFSDTFEDSLGSWSGTWAPASSVAGGHSLQFTGSTAKNSGVSLTKGSAYNLSFLAEGDGGNVTITASAGSSAFNNSVSVAGGSWGLYSLNLPALAQNETTITITTTGGVFIDNVQLIKTSDQNYLIDNSWATPASCDEDESGNPFPQYMLGCSSYNNHSGDTKYLHSFDHICSAVGCEAMIDTQNSDSPLADSTYGATTTVAADSIVYAAYDESKSCDQAAKGCELLGQKNYYGAEATYQSAYMINDPNKYNSILCGASGVGCNLFTTAGNSQDYFKDPGNTVCEWRQAASGANINNGNDGWGWYKKRVKRCGILPGGILCAAPSDCTNGTLCLAETSDTPCPTALRKTFGQGGAGNEISQPASDGKSYWAGACSQDQSGCTEYIDPVSDFSTELIYNGDFSQHVCGSNGCADGWAPTSNGTQNVNLDANTLYVYTASGGNANFTSTIAENGAAAPYFYTLGADNLFSAAPAGYVSIKTGESILFYTSASVSAKVFAVYNTFPPIGSKVSLKKAVVSYQLADTVDKTSCNGVAASSTGCIWFNQRSVDLSIYLGLNQNAWKQYDKSVDATDANVLLKVNPDRTCDQWLSCKSYVKDQNNKNVCFNIAGCNRLDDAGNCANFIVNDPAKQLDRTYDPTNPLLDNPNTIQNLTGYVKVGWYSPNSVFDSASSQFIDYKIIPNDLENFGQMTQLGKNVVIPNGDFEKYVATSTDGGRSFVGDPAGWTRIDGISWTPVTADSAFSVIGDPTTAQSEGVDYPMIGKAFLKYSASSDGTNILTGHYPRSGLIYVQPKQPYYLSYYVNTAKLGPVGAESLVGVYEYNNSNIAVGSHMSVSGIINGWRLVTYKFIPTYSQIRIMLGAIVPSNTPTAATGDIYIDDLEITPVLLARTATPPIVKGTPAISSDFYDRQTCRLFPQADSLGCDYFDSNGILQKGDRGYCLEYDRYPGDPNTCLLWWPIDNVLGAGVQSVSQSGYNGKSPLYYCIGANIGGNYVTNPNDGSTQPAVYPYILSNEIISSRSGSVKDTIDINGTEIVNTLDPSHPEWGNTNPFFLDTSQWLTLGGGIIDVIPLKYGINTMKITMIGDSGADHTWYRLAGQYHYLDTSGKPAIGNFDIPKFIAEILKATPVSTGEPNLTANSGEIYNKNGNSPIYNHDPGNLVEGGSIDWTSCTGDTSDHISISANGCGGCYSTNNVSREVQCPIVNDPTSDPPFFDYITGSETDHINRCDASSLCGGGDNKITITYTFNVPQPVCTKLAQVVNSEGQNKVWAEKFKLLTGITCNLKMPTDYNLDATTNEVLGPSNQNIPQTNYPLFGSTINTITVNPMMSGRYFGECTKDTQPTPFGAANAPEVASKGLGFLDDPGLWYLSYPNPLPYQVDSATKAQMGQLYTSSTLSSLFAASEGVWQWDGSSYVLDSKDDWFSTATQCNGNKRSGNIVICAAAPIVANLQVNKTGSAIVNGRGFVNVTFNSIVDSNQIPLASWEIDWGDGESLAVTGINMAPQPSATDPHSAYHAYDFYDLVAKSTSPTYKVPDSNGILLSTTLKCGASSCTVTPLVRLTDNWGWCTGGRTGNPCPNDISGWKIGPTITVNEP